MTTHDPLYLTTVIPVHNGEKFIEQTLESLSRSTRLPDRVIILDNASTDRTNKICRRWIKKQCGAIEIHLQRRENLISAVENFNTALSPITDCLHILSADDLIDSDFYERMLASLIHIPGPALIFSHIRQINANGDVIYSQRDGRYPHILTLTQFLSRQSLFHHVYCQSVILKTNRQPIISRFTNHPTPDIRFFADAAVEFKTIIEHRSVMISYRVHEASSTGQSVSSLSAIMAPWKEMLHISAMINESHFRRFIRLRFQRLIFACRNRLIWQRLTCEQFKALLAEETANITGSFNWFLSLPLTALRALTQRHRTLLYSILLGSLTTALLYPHFSDPRPPNSAGYSPVQPYTIAHIKFLSAYFDSPSMIPLFLLSNLAISLQLTALFSLCWWPVVEGWQWMKDKHRP